MILGLDCSNYQPALPWPAFAAGRRTFAIVKVSESDWADPMAGKHIAGAKAAGLEVAFYHFLGQTDGVLQARTFDKLAPHDDTLLYGCPRFWVDVEAGLNLAGTLTAFLYAWKSLRPNAAIGIYTGQGAWAATVGNQHTEFGAYPLWCGSRPLPAGWTRAAIQQNPVAGHLPGYAGDIDLDEIAEAPVTVPVITKGPKLGIHSIQPGNTLALVQKALDHGWHWPVVKILHDASVAADVKRLSPETLTIVRYMPPSADDEGLQNVDTWTLAQMRDWAARLIALIFSRTAAEHLPAVDYWDVTNEPGAHGVGYYHALGVAFIELVTEADRRGVHLSLPALPQGTPEWDEMIALTNTGLFGLMKAGGHIWDCHEGAFVDQPIEFGFGDVIPGAPTEAGAGSTSFRHKYLYRLLEQRNEVVPLVISEFYGGGRYSNSPADQLARFRWYDVRARAEPYLLAFCPFTVNPDGGWANADYGPTYASDQLWQWIDAEKDKLNGDDEMQPLYHARPLQDLLLRDAQGQPVTDPIAPSGAVLKGALVHVYKENVTAGAYSNRVQVTPDGKNIWGIATAIQRA